MDGFIYNSELAAFSVCDAASTLKTPLLINWNITGACCNSCLYCYGVDIKTCMPCTDTEELDAIISHLKYIQPKALVLTGGEPTMHPKYRYIIDTCVTFTNIILDSNGILLDENDLLYLKEKGVHLRISLDAEDAEINERIRRSKIPTSTEKVKYILKSCVENGINHTVQTVISSENVLHLPSLCSFLKSIKIKHWRLLDVVADTAQERLKPKGVIIQDVIKSLENGQMKISYSLESESDSSAVILIDPQGNYLCRKASRIKKQIVDVRNPKAPSLECLMHALNAKEHMQRYLLR